MAIKRSIKNIAVFVIYALLTILMTWPLAAKLGTHIPGSEGDAWVHQWTFRYVRDMLQNGGDLFYTELMYYPQGVSMLTHNFAWLHIGLWLPLQAIVGEATAYTLIFMGGFAFTGFTTFLLVRELLNDEKVAFVVGLITAFWPYTLSHHNHPNLIFIGFVPLVMLWSKRVIEKNKWQDVIILGIMIALLGLTRWQLLLIASPLILLFLLWQLNIHKLAITTNITEKWRATKKSLLQLIVAGALGFSFMLPLLYPLLANQMTQSNLEEIDANEQRPGQTDLLAYVTPSRYHPIWGEAVFPLTENYTVDRVFTPFLGITTMLLALYGIIRRWQFAKFWLFAAIVYIVLALGGYLQINGEFYFPLPYLLVEESFIGAMIRRSSRFNVILSIPIAILAGLGLAQLRLSRKRAHTLLPIVALLILFEYAVIYPTFPLATPDWYEQLAQEEGDFAILDLPMNPRTYDEQYMFYQFTHGKSLVGGHVSRPPHHTYSFIETIPFLQTLQKEEGAVPFFGDVGQQLRQLAEADVRYVVLHKRFIGTTKLEQWKEWLVIKPMYENDELVVYNTNVEPNRDFELMSEFKPQVGIIQSHISPKSTTQAGWINVYLVLGSATTVANVDEICIKLIDQSSQVKETECQTAVVPVEQWQAGEIVHNHHQIQISPYLDKGNYTVVAELHNSIDDEYIGEPVVLDQIELSTITRTFKEPKPLIKTDLEWNDGEIALLGYDLVEIQNSEEIELTLHWAANERPEGSYVRFVHVINTETNELVMQSDQVPLNGAYPTYWWESGEFIDDKINLSLAELPAGEYEIVTGLYDLQSQARLTVAQNGRLIRNNIVQLQTFMKSITDK